MRQTTKFERRSWVRYLLRPFLSSRRGFRPDFRDSYLLGALAKNSPGFAEFRHSSTDRKSLEVVARYFRERTEPKFFVDTDQLALAAHTVSQDHGAWQEALRRTIREVRERGVRLYGRRGPALRAGFPWGGAIGGAGQDKLYAKRPHRFAFAPRVALAALYGEPVDGFLGELMRDWMSFASSRDSKLAYDSNLAVIQRVLALSWTWAFLAARSEPSSTQLLQESLVLKIMHADVQFLAPRLGESHPNNHLLVDMFAGWFLGLVWPELVPEKDWRTKFEPCWLKEIERQTLADGTSFEHSTHYHEFACEMATAYVLLSRRNSWDVPDWMLERTRRLLKFQADLAGPEAVTVAVGDATEDSLFPLDDGDGWGTGAWGELHRALFRSDVDVRNDAPSRERAFWLLGGQLAPPTDERSTGHRLDAYPDGGFFVFTEANAESRLIFRTGPRERARAFGGHMHADLMSIFVTAKGRPFIVDPGTYTYRGERKRSGGDEPGWRRYFMGSASHNALSIENCDPLGSMAGDFRPTKIEAHADTVKVFSEATAAWVHGVVRGGGVYASYQRGVTQVPGEYWVIYDVVPPARGDSRRSFGFQFAHQCDVTVSDAKRMTIANDGVSLALVASHGLTTPVLLEGSRDPLGGWVSPRYGEIHSAPQARFGVAGESDVSAFLLCPRGRNKELGIAADRVGEFGLVLRIQYGRFRDTLLLNQGSRSKSIRVDGIDFAGDLAWVRCRDGSPSVVTWVNGRRFEWKSKGVRIESARRVPALEVSSVADGISLKHCERKSVAVHWQGTAVGKA